MADLHRSASLGAQIQEVIKSLDLDNNGQIEWREFACLMANRWLKQDGETDMALAIGLLTSEEDDEEVDVERSKRTHHTRTRPRAADRPAAACDAPWRRRRCCRRRCRRRSSLPVCGSPRSVALGVCLQCASCYAHKGSLL